MNLVSVKELIDSVYRDDVVNKVYTTAKVMVMFKDGKRFTILLFLSLH